MEAAEEVVARAREPGPRDERARLEAAARGGARRAVVDDVLRQLLREAQPEVGWIGGCAGVHGRPGAVRVAWGCV